MAEIEKIGNNKCWGGCGKKKKKRNLCALLVGMQTGAAIVEKQYGGSSKN